MVKLFCRHYYLMLFIMLIGCKKEVPKVNPTIFTNLVTNITAHSAQTGGTCMSDGGTVIIARGICWSKTNTPSISDSITKDSLGSLNYTSILTNLDFNTTYYIRAYATNSVGTSYGRLINFTTLTSIPIIFTDTILKIGQNNAIIIVQIKSSGGEKITSKGICWSSKDNPTISDNTNFTTLNTDRSNCYITGLEPNSKYYCRSFATNAKGTGYGNTITFNTNIGKPSTIEDIDFNLYKTITIGNQTWMQENLKTTKFSNGENITTKTDISWNTLNEPAYCWYNNDSIKYKTLYSGLYNWYSVISDKNICPAGWHPSSTKDWDTLMHNINYSADKLKEAGTLHWNATNTGTNSSGFTAIPSGVGGGNYFYTSRGSTISADESQIACWWVKFDYVNPIYYFLRKDNGIYLDVSSEMKNYGMNVRCVKN